MATPLELKEYLDNTTESSKRLRTIVTILLVVTVLILAGFLNSWGGYAWGIDRIRYRTDYNKELELKIQELQHQQYELLAGGTPEHTFKIEKLDDESARFPLLKKRPAAYGKEVCAAQDENVVQMSSVEQQLKCYEGAKKINEKFLEEAIKAYVDNTYLIKVPFFGVAFDINDLGAIGGLSLIVILLMLRLNLRNFIVSLRIGFKAAGQTGAREDFYDILACRQLFAFPVVAAPEQEPYNGLTERVWTRLKVRLHLVRKKNTEQKPGWQSNRHAMLALIPALICLIPSIVYGAVVVNDVTSFGIGRNINPTRATSGLVVSILCFFVIFALGCWCISKWIEIESLWERFCPGEECSPSPR